MELDPPPLGRYAASSLNLRVLVAARVTGVAHDDDLLHHSSCVRSGSELDELDVCTGVMMQSLGSQYLQPEIQPYKHLASCKTASVQGTTESAVIKHCYTAASSLAACL